MSNYGKKWDVYNLPDNVRRKLCNTGTQTGIGPNVNTKSYGVKSTVLPNSLFHQLEAIKVKTQSGPVKIYTEEEKKALAKKMGL